MNNHSARFALQVDRDTGIMFGTLNRRQKAVSEIERVIHELGFTRGHNPTVGAADRTIIMDALRQYGEHLLIAATTVRTVKPAGADRKAVSGYLETISARANLLANCIDSSEGLMIIKVGEG